MTPQQEIESLKEKLKIAESEREYWRAMANKWRNKLAEASDQLAVLKSKVREWRL